MSARRLLSALAALAATASFGVALDGCNQQSVEATLHSLQASSEVTFVCRGQGSGRGHEPGDCPDFADPRTRTMLAVVTQTATNELAVVSIDDQKVVDLDLSIPGYTFLRLPSRPGDIVSTPGGEASFVGLTSTGKTGIAAIPTTCLGPPRGAEEGEEAQHSRDVTTFAYCALSSAPGDMAVVVEPPAEDGTIAETCADAATAQRESPPGAVRDTVLDAADEAACTEQGGAWDAADGCHVRRDCLSDLTLEAGTPGRRKLVVTLPDEGKLVVIDAQSLLDRRPGSFAPCAIEKELALAAALDASGQREKVPDDFPAGSCAVAEPTPPPVPPSAASRPSGVAVTDGRLFVGDLGVPLVHVVDVSSVCHLEELPSLLPMSFAAPSRLVTTSRVAVSSVTPAGKQYVYAVDAGDQPTTSVMAFDVSEGVTERTPIMKPGSARQPREAPDRIAFAAPVADITFAYRDLPKSDVETGVAEIGVRCDPDPAASIDPPTPGVQYRTTADYTQGARPALLRGLFGLVMLTSGQVVVIDVDDFDAPCRRPRSTNETETPDYRGCAGDSKDYEYLTYKAGEPEETGMDPDGTSSVSDEVSCNMVEPHRARSAAFGVSKPTLGLGAPSLRGFPQFNAPPSVINLTPEDRPKLMAVPFEPVGGGEEIAPVVYVGTTLYGGTQGTTLPTDPNASADRNTVTLPLVEPRSYPSNDRSVLTYEGRVIAADPSSGFLAASGADFVISDTTVYFCDQGVFDRDTMAGYARDVLGMDPTAADAFAIDHADYVQITGDFPSIIDSYWGSALAPAGGREQCELTYGSPPRAGDSELDAARDFAIKEAYQDHLVVAPRTPPGDDAPPGPPTVAQCFPGGFRYTVRGSQQWVLATTRPTLSHDVIADAADGYRCTRDCDPRKRFFRSRVFEIAATDTCEGDDEACNSVTVGAGSAADGPCRYDPTAGVDEASGLTRGLTLADEASRCIFENLTSRFAVYRGRAPSVRDMSFAWDTAGGFVPLSGSLAAISGGVLPQHLVYVSEYQAIAVVDAANLGLSLMNLDSLRIHDPWPVY